MPSLRRERRRRGCPTCRTPAFPVARHRSDTHLHHLPRTGRGGYHLLRPRRRPAPRNAPARSEAHTSELQSLMRITSAVSCLQNTTSIRHHSSTSDCIQTYTQQPQTVLTTTPSTEVRT